MGSHRLPRRAPQPLRRSPPVPLEGAPLFAVPREWDAKLGGQQWPWPSAPRLADIMEPERNSFGVLRLMLALAVIVSHAVFLARGNHAAEPLFGLTGYSLGQYAVQAFFILSGILVTQSLVKRESILDYLRARAVRIFPALIACVLVTALAIGPALTYFSTTGYFMSFGVVEYIVKTLTLSTGSAQLPGLFQLNPAGPLVNQSLWTLKYEIACYLLLGGLAVIIGRMNSKRMAVGIALSVWALMMLMLKPSLTADRSFFAAFSYFALFFGTGTAAYLLRTFIRVSWQPLVVLLGLFVIGVGSDLAEITSAAFLGYALLWLSTFKFGGLRAFANENDYSYGAYIYSFPVTQAILTLWPEVNLLSLIGMSLGATVLLAMLSWELIERPALSLVRRWHEPVAPVQVVKKVSTRAPIVGAPVADQYSMAEVLAPAIQPVVDAVQPVIERVAPVATARNVTSTPVNAPVQRVNRSLFASPRAAAAAAKTTDAKLFDRSKLEARLARISKGSEQERNI